MGVFHFHRHAEPVSSRESSATPAAPPQAAYEASEMAEPDNGYEANQLSSSSDSYDVEKGWQKDPPTDQSLETEEYGYTTEYRRKWYQRVIDSYKPAPEIQVDTTGMTEEEAKQARLAAAPLSKSLSNRHIQMIAIGGSIGSGLFVSSGNSLAQGGPAGVIIGFAIVGIMLYTMMHSIGEVAVRFPVQGSFAIHTIRLVDDSWGFAMSWNYVLQWLVSFPLELTAAAMILDYWNYDNNGATRVNKAAWVALFWFVFTCVGFTGARAYGEVEFLLSIIKVTTIIGFCIFGIIITAGGGPRHHYFGTHYWWDPGSFANGFKGVVAVFVNSAFAFSGTEMAALAAAETKDAARVLPRAVKQVFWRVLLFYMISLTVVFCLVPYTDPHLGTSSDGSASPFVLAIKAAGVSGLPSVMNTVILLAALSVADAAIYGTSRTMSALAQADMAPKILGYYDREGRPLVAIAVTSMFGLIGFIVASDKYEEAFLWMQALSGQSSLYAWGSIGLNQIMFRYAMKAQGRSLDELFYKSATGAFGGWVTLGINLAILGLQMWVAIWPLGEKPSAYNWFSVYLSLPIALSFFIAHKLWYRTWPRNPKTVDIVTGARIKTPEQIEETRLEEEALDASPWYHRYPIKIFRFWC